MSFRTCMSGIFCLAAAARVALLADVAENPRLGNAWSDPRNPIVQIFGGDRLDLWSLKPVGRPGLPQVQRAGWATSPVDLFVLSGLERKGLAPAPPADRRTLARRLYFGLWGLPPSPEAVEAFERDPQPGAYERLVEQLLASPRYGEHWGRQWLDVIRYSDSNGFDWDEFRPSAWRFRDYVIRAFNADKPFNQLILEQLAGDELFDGPPGSAREQDLLLATGYLRLGPHDNSAPLFNEQARSRAELMNDLVETTGSAFLAITFSCARCHDHKFDPISHEDYYRFRAFFEPVKFSDGPLDLADQQERINKHNGAIDRKIAPLAEERDLRKKEAEPASDGAAKTIEEDAKKRVAELDKQIAALASGKWKFQSGLVMSDNEGPAPATHILNQGNHKDPLQPVLPGFLSVLDPNPARIESPVNSKTTGRRLTLAKWLSSTENPLTARVFVNRVWQAHFGTGLVETANDFGLAGARPVQPELLDWLASEFVNRGWSIKELHRVILFSAAYRQTILAASQAGGAFTAENTRVWRQNLRRLTAEQLRDSVLAVSGLLRDRTGGPPVWPELPPEILQANPAFLDDNAEKTKSWYPSPAAEQTVRTLFLVQKRTVRVPFLETFDLPENSVSCPRREMSIVPPQALSLLNGPLTVSAATAMAERIRLEATTPDEQIRRAFELALQRKPQIDEERAASSLLRERTLEELCRALFNVNEFIFF